MEEYAMATQAIEEARAEQAKNAPPATAEQLEAMSQDPAVLAAGAATYKANCVACHGDKGEGKIGPNLTDRYWLHGADPMEIHTTVSQGVPAKGMPPWGPVLGPGPVQEVVAYVLTLRNTNVQGKGPEGEEVLAQQ
jgi:cytochrome c oxidase cbb3-type subunit 3